MRRTEYAIKDRLPQRTQDGTPIHRNLPGKEARIAAFASDLPKYGVRSGQVIGVMLPSGCQKDLVVEGLLHFGCTDLLLDPNGKPQDVKKKVEDAGVKLVFTSGGHIDIASQLKVCLAYLP